MWKSNYISWNFCLIIIVHNKIEVDSIDILSDNDTNLVLNVSVERVLMSGLALSVIEGSGWTSILSLFVSRN